MSATITASDAAALFNHHVGRAGLTVGDWTLVVDVEDSPVNRVSRWHEMRWLVVRNGDGELFGVEYGVGLTEDQEDRLPWVAPPYGRRPETVELVPLVAHEITRTEYRRA